MLVAGDGVRAACVAAMLVLMVGPVGAEDSPAHMLADKFAGDGAEKARETPKETPEEARRAEEARKKEAEEKALEALRETARRQAESALKADRDKLKAQGKIVTPKAPAKSADDAKAEETEMLARARREDEDRKAAEQQARAEEDARRAIAEADKARQQLEAILQATETQPAPKEVATPSSSAPAPAAIEPGSNPEVDTAAVAQTRRIWRESAERIARQARAEAEQKALADAAQARQKVVADARRTWRQSTLRIEAEENALAEAAQARRKVVADAQRAWRQSADRIAEQARVAAEEKARVAAAAAAPVGDLQADAARAPASTPVAAPASAPSTDPIATQAAIPARAPQALAGHVTILIVMTPGNKGIRRNNKLADPVLCFNDGCYISAGPDTPARFMPAHKALGFGNTWGERAGACRNQLGCVFRKLAVTELPLLVQPIDMRVIKHDRRRMQAIEADSQCRMDGQRLFCAHGIYAEDYAMWIVPESLAAEAGPAALEKAVADGLNGPRSAGLAPGRL